MLCGTCRAFLGLSSGELVRRVGLFQVDEGVGRVVENKKSKRREDGHEDEPGMETNRAVFVGFWVNNRQTKALAGTR